MTVLRIVLLVVAAVAVLVLLRAAFGATGETRRRRLRRRRHEPGAAGPADMLAIERTLWMATASAQDEHYRLVPIARGIAAHRLAAHHGVDLDRDPAAARALLGADAWQLVEPHRTPPPDRFARGLGSDRLHRLVDALERLGGQR